MRDIFYHLSHFFSSKEKKHHPISLQVLPFLIQAEYKPHKHFTFFWIRWNHKHKQWNLPLSFHHMKAVSFWYTHFNLCPSCLSVHFSNTRLFGHLMSCDFIIQMITDDVSQYLDKIPESETLEKVLDGLIIERKEDVDWKKNSYESDFRLLVQKCSKLFPGPTQQHQHQPVDLMVREYVNYTGRLLGDRQVNAMMDMLEFAVNKSLISGKIVCEASLTSPHMVHENEIFGHQPFLLFIGSSLIVTTKVWGINWGSFWTKCTAFRHQRAKEVSPGRKHEKKHGTNWPPEPDTCCRKERDIRWCRDAVCRPGYQAVPTRDLTDETICWSSCS